MLTACEEHPPVPSAFCLGTAALTQPWQQALSTSQKWALPMEGARGEALEQAECEVEAAGPQLPGKSSWIIPGVGQTGSVVLEAAVARIREEHSPMEEPAAGTALGLISHSPLCSGKSLGTECK